jgi:hypothetical protein
VTLAALRKRSTFTSNKVTILSQCLRPCPFIRHPEWHLTSKLERWQSSEVSKIKTQNKTKEMKPKTVSETKT